MDVYKCDGCNFGPCYFVGIDKPFPACPCSEHRHIYQNWRRVPTTQLLSEIAKVDNPYSAGDWVYDTGASDYFYIEFADDNDLSVIGHYLGSNKTITRYFDYCGEYFREASLVEMSATDMYTLVGKVIKNVRTGDAEFVFSCSETGNGSDPRVCTFKHPDGIPASDLLLEWEFLDGKPCGVFCRKDENGEWV